LNGKPRSRLPGKPRPKNIRTAGAGLQAETDGSTGKRRPKYSPDLIQLRGAIVIKVIRGFEFLAQQQQWFSKEIPRDMHKKARIIDDGPFPGRRYNPQERPMANRKKALIIDQSPVFRRTLKDVIQTSEPHVAIQQAPGADQALRILEKETQDVVFMDIVLPGGNGMEFIGRIKDLLPHTRIVVLTSHDSAEHEEASLRCGADYFLSKERAVGLPLINIIQRTLSKGGGA
jgi:CheY-like chemotaxis protein